MEWRPTDPSGECVRINGRGVPYEEFTCLYPTIGSTYFSFEKNHEPVAVYDWMTSHPYLPEVCIVLYAAMIIGGQAYFKDRPAWNWRGTLALWNLALSIFSAWGFIRLAPLLLHNLVHYTWRENLCLDPESTVGSGHTSLAGQLFVFSKIPELIDTFFILIHKKKLIFLHYFHHASVVFFVYHGYLTKPTMGIPISVMNYGVHSFMYFYYFLMAIRAKPKWLKAQWITIAQISQMVIGVGLTPFFYYLYFVERIPGCWIKHDQIVKMSIMYTIFLLLFLQFFFRRYFNSVFTVKGKITKRKTV